MATIYVEIVDVERLIELSKEMKKVAKDNFIDDYEKFVLEVQNHSQSDRVGEMVRFYSDTLSPLLVKYTRFLALMVKSVFR